MTSTWGKADLVYWDMSIAGNSGRLLMGIVHLERQTAHLVWDYGQDLAHTQLVDAQPTSHRGQPEPGAGGVCTIGDLGGQPVLNTVRLLRAPPLGAYGLRPQLSPKRCPTPESDWLGNFLGDNWRQLSPEEPSRAFSLGREARSGSLEPSRTKVRYPLAVSPGAKGRAE
jgi:hypothetical protein